jgi:signal-transduction protein with cAMP-binding, CBS, and nucleotidyltransferase domain
MPQRSAELEGVLRATPVFRRLAPQDLHTLAQAASLKRYQKGEVIFEQDTPADAF